LCYSILPLSSKFLFTQDFKYEISQTHQVIEASLCFEVDLIFISGFADIYVTENRGEFLEKLQRARAQVKPNTPSQPVLSRPGQTRLVVGNWALASRKEGELHIHNSDGQQVVSVLQGQFCMQVASSVSHTRVCVCVSSCEVAVLRE
jgi:hypothetical protein